MKFIVDSNYAKLRTGDFVKAILDIGGQERHIAITDEGLVIDDVTDEEVVQTLSLMHEELLELPKEG